MFLIYIIFIFCSLLVLDEMDQLLTSRGNEFLYKIFEMTQLPKSKLILVGVANSLDLTTRHLPLLSTSASPNSTKGRQRIRSDDTVKRCELLHFPPYAREQIAQILETRLSAVDVFDPLAIKLVANKVASSTGDMRKALHACKSALDQMEKQERVVLKETADDGKFLAFKGIVVYRRFSNCRRSLTMAGSLINAGGQAKN